VEPPTCIGEQKTVGSAVTSVASGRPLAINARLGREWRRPATDVAISSASTGSSAYATRSTMCVRTPASSPAASARISASSRSIDAAVVVMAAATAAGRGR
jgi:hypothetical protein